MKSFIAALRSLVLPYGATSGARIVLDGVNGSIQVYNSAGVQIGVLDGTTGFKFTGTNETFQIGTDGVTYIRENPDVGAFLELTAAAGFGGLVFFNPENSSVPGLVFFPAALYADALEVAGVSSRPKLQITSPYVRGTPDKATAQLVLIGQTNTSATDNSQALFNAAELKTTGDLTVVGGILVTINDGANPIETYDTSVTNGSTSSAAFVDSLTTTGVIGISFVAPRSGGIWIAVQGGGFNTTALATLFLDFNIRNGGVVGSGAIFRAADTNSCGEHQSAVANHIGHMSSQGYVANLTPGATYNATMAYAVTSGTGFFRRRKITVSPNIINF